VVTAPDLFPHHSRRHSPTLEEIVLRPSEREKVKRLLCNAVRCWNGCQLLLLRTDRFSTLGKDGLSDSEQGWRTGLTCRVNVRYCDYRRLTMQERRGGAGGKKSENLFLRCLCFVLLNKVFVCETSAPAKLLICRMTRRRPGAVLPVDASCRSYAGRGLRDGGDYGYPTLRVIITRLPSL
jgi:hypothetical protein